MVGKSLVLDDFGWEDKEMTERFPRQKKFRRLRTILVALAPFGSTA
jgi:hypothetical protein